MSASNTSLSQKIRILESADRQVVAEVNPFPSRERLRNAAMRVERMRLARELHDGVLQSLTAAVLQLETVWHLIENDPDAARTHLRAVQQMIGREQNELRLWLEKLGSAVSAMSASCADLAGSLRTLRERITMQWGLRVELELDVRGTVPRVLRDEIYRIVQEGLSNAGRHAKATLARVCIKVDRGSNFVRIMVADDGGGFPFRGRFDLAELTARQIGPKSLRERVVSLGGELIVTSKLSGSRIDIGLPLEQGPRRVPVRHSANM